MGRSEAQKRAEKNYYSRNRKSNMTTRSLHMTNAEYWAFVRACEVEGITPHAVLLAAAREVIGRHPELGIPEVGEPGRKAEEYDKELFDELYQKVMSGEMKSAEAAEKLGVHLRKWYRLAKARKEKGTE